MDFFNRLFKKEKFSIQRVYIYMYLLRMVTDYSKTTRWIHLINYLIEKKILELVPFKFHQN